MNPFTEKKPFIAIACGGTGGHLFPGLAVAEELRQRGCSVALLISPKDVDQQAVKNIQGLEIFTLPAVGLQNRNYFSFGLSFWKSYRLARKFLRQHSPMAVLAMGGFTSAPPILAARSLGARTFLHESNTIPGRANRMLARWVDEAFVGFPEAAGRLKARRVTVTGTPVRPQFSVSENPMESRSRIAACREALGLEPDRPVILAVGGSQGATGLNEMVLSLLNLPAAKDWQWLHLTGTTDFERVKAAYAAREVKAVVKPFLAQMDLALGAATACVSRSGASSLAEMAAMRLPSVLVPFPAAADNHQFFNATAFETTHAAMMLEQKRSSPETLAEMLTQLVEDAKVRLQIQTALAARHVPQAAAQIAENILQASSRPAKKSAHVHKHNCGCRVHRPAKALH